MEIPVLQGREFTDTDVLGYAGGIVINQTLARAWGDQSPIGRQVTVFKAAKELPQRQRKNGTRFHDDVWRIGRHPQ